jgi:5-methyltetrahydrofolate--homocysteine methyltransferase
MDTLVEGAKTKILIGSQRPTAIIGNRIDAAINERITTAVRTMDMSPIEAEAIAQVRDGADVIQIKLDLEGIDEVKALPTVVEAVGRAVPLPICLNTKNSRALQAALEVCSGKPLVNAITGEEQSIKELLPIVVKRKAAVITLGFDKAGLPYEFDGLPVKFDETFELARLVLRKALAAGMPRENIIVGIPTVPVTEDPAAAAATLELIARLARIEQLNVALDPRGISQGLPDEGFFDQVFLAAAMARGVTCATIDPLLGRKVVRATDLVLNKDAAIQRYYAFDSDTPG